MVVVEVCYVYCHLPEGGRGGGDCTVRTVCLVLVSLVHTERSTVKPRHIANSPNTQYRALQVACPVTISNRR